MIAVVFALLGVVSIAMIRRAHTSAQAAYPLFRRRDFGGLARRLARPVIVILIGAVSLFLVAGKVLHWVGARPDSDQIWLIVAILVGLCIALEAARLVALDHWMFTTSRLKPVSRDPHAFVYIDDDGAAHELEPDQIKLLGAPYDRFDGFCVKDRYDSLTFDGRLRGYLERRKLPLEIRVIAISELEPVTTEAQAIDIAIGEFARSIGAMATQPDSPYSAELKDGVWRVTGLWQGYGGDYEVYISAASGRMMHHGKWGPPSHKLSRPAR
jgi:hypothetical protein